jgi:TonB family protein
VLWKRKAAPVEPSPVAALSPAPLKPATPAPPTVTSGILHVESTPAGAVLTIDGNSVGKTPIDVPDLALGAHEVKIELEGYAPVTESVVLSAQAPRSELAPTLTRTAPATGRADVTSTPEGATVKIDGAAVGLTPLRGRSLNVGRHRIEIDAPGYETHTGTVVVREGQTARLDATLKPVAVPSPKAAVATPAPAPTPDTHVYDENDGTLTQKPVKTGGKSAEYPRDAPQLKRGQRASVTCSFIVTENGDVADVQVVESAGEAVDNAVVSAYKTWKFTPASKQGQKVRVRVTRRQTFLGG